ncbi:hypothetical protein GGI21_000584, partial [Coemansia aciculifera]
IPLVNRLLEYPDGRRKIQCQESGWLQPSLVKLIHSKLRQLKRVFIDNPNATLDSVSVDYNELGKALYRDRKAEEVEIKNANLLKERRESAIRGQSSQAGRKHIDATVDNLMQSLRMAEGNEEEADEPLLDFDDYDIYGEESEAESQSEADDD